MEKILSEDLENNYESIGVAMANGESIINSEPSYLPEPPCNEKALGRCDCKNKCSLYNKVDITRII